MTRSKPPRIDTQTRIEVAMCLWEAVLEEMRVRRVPNKWSRLAEEIGTCELRTRVAALVDYAEWSWRIAAEEFEYGSPFDWEWCPAFIERATDERCRLRVDALFRMRLFAARETRHDARG